MGSLNKIVLPTSALFAGMCHALVTDREEVMGLILGTFDVHSPLMLALHRSDGLV